MINPNKLFQLSGGQQRRKLALCFGALERDILGIAEKGSEYNFHSMPRADYIRPCAASFCKIQRYRRRPPKRFRPRLKASRLTSAWPAIWPATSFLP